MIDWSTYDTVAGTVLGCRRTISFDSYANVESAFNSLNIAGYTNWRMPNLNEMFNFCDKSDNYTAYMNFPPFNIAINSTFHTSTLRGLTVGFIITNVSRDISVQLISTSRMAIPVRTFTVTGTTLS
jgi:hypothetical protein